MKLTEYLNALNYTKENLFDTEDHLVEKEYAPFVVNRCCSLDKRMQFDYLRLSMRKRKRFSKWLKRESVQDLELIKEYFNYSDSKAREALDILTKEDIDNIRQKMYRGGKNPI